MAEIDGREESVRDKLQREEDIARKKSLLEQAAAGHITLTDAERTALVLDLKALTRTTKRPTIGSICVVIGMEPGAERDACKIVKDRGKHSVKPYGVQWLEIRSSGAKDTTLPGTRRLFVDGKHLERELVRREARSELAILDQLQEEQLRLATPEEERDYYALEARIRAREERGLNVEDFVGRNRRVLHPRCHTDNLEVRCFAIVCSVVFRAMRWDVV